MWGLLWFNEALADNKYHPRLRWLHEEMGRTFKTAKQQEQVRMRNRMVRGVLVAWYTVKGFASVQSIEMVKKW